MPSPRLLRRLPAALAGLGLGLSCVMAQAGLLEDDEARKAILDLRTRLSQQAAQLQQQSEQLQQFQRNLLDLSTQNEQLRVDIARLRGQNEQLLRDLADVQRGQRDIVQGLDERMRRIEPQKVSVDGREFSADPDEKKTYEDAMNALRAGDFERAAATLGNLLRRYPDTGYGDAARYWLGNAQYGLRDYKNAIATFRAFLAAAPDHPRTPEALLAVANCQAEMKDPKAARKTLEELVKRFPKSEAAQAAKERLVALK